MNAQAIITPSYHNNVTLYYIILSTGKRKHVDRPSRSEQLKKTIKQIEAGEFEEKADTNK